MYRRDRNVTLIITLLLVFSGINSSVLIVATLYDSGTEPVTITVEIPELPSVPVPVEKEKVQVCEATPVVQKRILSRNATHKLSPLFDKNVFLVVGEKAFCTDVLGAAKLSYALAFGGAAENPEGRTDALLTPTENISGNLIIVGGPAVNPVAIQYGAYFRISYEWNPDDSYKINADCKSIYLDLRKYPQEDVCIVYLREYRGRNVLMVWGYGWQGTYAGSIFAADPNTWETYPDVRMFLLRWKDTNNDGLVQQGEIVVETYVT
jgi:hypothetical protein